MIETRFKNKYYKVRYWNNDIIATKYFPMRKPMIEFINSIEKYRIVDVVFIRELNLVED